MTLNFAVSSELDVHHHVQVSKYSNLLFTPENHEWKAELNLCTVLNSWIGYTVQANPSL